MKHIIAGAGALWLLAGVALAQNGTPGAHFIEQWDMDGDAQVTLDEAREKRGDVFAMFDADGNGVLGADEWQSIADHLSSEAANGHAPAMGRGPGKFIHDAMTPAFNDADGNSDVTTEEFVTATDRLFAQIDRNGDEVMTSADFGR